MEIFIGYLFLFIFGAVAGWFLEVGYRSLKNKRLINPGFLSGPYLPLYGVGVILVHCLCGVDYSFIENRALQILFYVVIVILSVTIAELVTGLVFMKFFKIKLWNYSDQKFNFMGIVSPLFSIIWGVLGLLYYFLINPWIVGFSVWVSGNLLAILVMGIVYGIFFFDTFNTLQVGSQIKQVAAKLKIVINYEDLKRKYKWKLIEEDKKTWFFNPFRLSRASHKFKEAIMESRIYKKILIKAKRRPKDKHEQNENKKDI